MTPTDAELDTRVAEIQRAIILYGPTIECWEDNPTLARAICLALAAARADAARKEPPAKAHGCEVGE